jgi:ketosteroid isomerase-like protein
MRNTMSCLIVLCIFVSTTLGQNAPNDSPKADTGAAQHGDYAVLQQIESDWLQGENTTDVFVLERVLADDYVNLTPRGLGPGKAEIIRHLQPRAGQAPPYTLETRDMHIYVLGDSAVVAYLKTYTAKENGNVVHEDTTHIFTKDNGVWRLKVSRASACQHD